MKINAIYKVCLLLAACMSLAACNEENIVDYKQEALEPLTINATPKTTRTSLAEDGKSIIWQNGDEIAVYDFTVAKHKFEMESFEGNEAHFFGKITAKKENFLVLYPYELGADNLDGDNNISVTLPTEQTAVVSNFTQNLNISVGKGKRNIDGSPSILTFHNVCQLLKFEVPEYATGKISKIEFTANTAVAGILTVNCTGETPMTSVATDGSKTITILPPTGTNTFVAGTYYIVSAAVQLNSFSMSFVCDGNSYSLRSNTTFGGEAGKIYSLGKIDLVETPLATTTHVYNNGVLAGTKLTLTNAPIQANEWSAVVKNASRVTVRTLSGSGDLTSTEDDSNWPYLPTGAYTVDYSFTNSNKKTITKSISFNITEKPSFTVSTYAYTSFSYYKGDGVTKDTDKANSLNNMTIYEPRITINRLDSKILNNSNYTFTSQMSNVNSSIKGRNGAVITYNNATVSSLGSFSLTGLVTFDNTSISAVKTVHITGLPYSAIPPSQSNGWTGSPREWNSQYVYLRNQTVTKNFHCSEDISVKIIQTVALKGTTSLGIVHTSAKYALSCSGTKVSEKSTSRSNSSPTYSDESINATLKSSNPSISCQSTSSGSTDVKVYKIVLQYR